MNPGIQLALCAAVSVVLWCVWHRPIQTPQRRKTHLRIVRGE